MDREAGDRRQEANIEARLASLSNPVRLIFFTQTFGCDSCLMARQVVNQVAALSGLVSVEEVNLVLDKDRAGEFGVDRAPAVAVVGGKDLGIRYYGVPSGHELASLVDAVLLAGSGELGLTAATLDRLAALDQAVDIKVFVTPT
jgi:alkyl hydroperoxide reductase subunit AhpF